MDENNKINEITNKFLKMYKKDDVNENERDYWELFVFLVKELMNRIDKVNNNNDDSKQRQILRILRHIINLFIDGESKGYNCNYGLNLLKDVFANF